MSGAPASRDAERIGSYSAALNGSARMHSHFIPVCRPCLACAADASTNRPMSYHLKKGVRKHLASGICFFSASGARAALPPLVEIEDTSCICLACVKVIDGLITQLDNARSLRPARTIAKRRRRISSTTSAPLITLFEKPHTQRMTPSPQLNIANADIKHVISASLQEPQHPTPIRTAIPVHLEPQASPSAPVPVPVPPLPPVPDGICVICFLSSSSGVSFGDSAMLSDEGMTTLGQLHSEITEQVGTHLSTLESTVRNFRAARVELAEGVCAFDSRTFTVMLASTNEQSRSMVVCHVHREALVQAAASKAAGALACAVCGDKPTLRGGEEVRSLATACLLNTPNHILSAVLMRLMGPSLADVPSFAASARSFVEKEFACVKCLQLLENNS